VSSGLVEGRKGVNMKIRVLHVLDKISVDSGVSSVVMNYYNKLEHDKLTFDFMLNEDVDAGTRASIESNGSKIFIMPRLKAANVFKYIKALKIFYKNNDYQIIHGHVANSAVFYLGLAKNVPYRIIHSHSIRAADIWWKRIRNWVLSRFIKLVANRYIACSSEAAIFLFGRNNNALILNNAIDADKFIFDPAAREKIRGELGLDGKLVIGHVGRFSAVKNHDFLVDVFHEICRSNNDTRLMLIGDGELYSDIVKKVEKLKLKEAVLFLGTTDNISACMNAMDIFVLPSLFEGLGIVAVEAQTSGLPVFLSDRVPREADITGKCVFLSLKKELWVDELRKLHLNDSDGRIKYGMKARGSRFDIDAQVGELYKYYRELAEKP
jgi:glycosyltransferase involved in cell wall biosynthesis